MSQQPQQGGPPRSGSMAANQEQPNGQRIEAIKQYYNQLCANLRHIVNQINAPETTPQRKQVLLQQQEQVQKSLQEFTEKVLKPLASAAANTGHGGPPRSQSQALPNNQPIAHNATRQQVSPPPAPPTIAMAMPPSQQQQQHQQQPQQAPPPPPMMFQNAPLATRQALLAIQKQAQLIQQQQILFGQKLHSKNFDSSLNHAHQAECRRNFDAFENGSANFTMVSKLATDGGSESSAKNRNMAFGKTVHDLVAEACPKLKVTPELEDGLLRIADDFIDNIASFAAQLALNRKDTKITKKDFEIAADRIAGVMLPGSHRSTIMSTSIRKLTKRTAGVPTNNPHLTRMAQLKKHFAQNPNA